MVEVGSAIPMMVSISGRRAHTLVARARNTTREKPSRTALSPQHRSVPTNLIITTPISSTMAETKTDEEQIPDMSLLDITDGENERKIPAAKFIEDIAAFAASFSPPASAELLIGAYSELHSKFKTFETSLTQKSKYELVVFEKCTFILQRRCGVVLHFYQ